MSELNQGYNIVGLSQVNLYYAMQQQYFCFLRSMLWDYVGFYFDVFGSSPILSENFVKIDLYDAKFHLFCLYMFVEHL